jgi:hypothetical protein
MVEAILDGQPKLLEPQQPDAVRKSPRKLAPDLVVELPVDDAQPVQECVHSLSPIEIASIEPAAAQDMGQ